MDPEINLSWKKTCKVLFGEDIGDLGEYENWLLRYIEPFGTKKSSISGREVIVSSDKMGPDAKFISHDEIDRYMKGIGKKEFSLNDIKDVDSIVRAASEKAYYIGNVVLGNSLNVQTTNRCINSSFVYKTQDVYDCKFIACSSVLRFAGAFTHWFSQGDMVVIINTGEGISDRTAVKKHYRRELMKTVAMWVSGIVTAIAVLALAIGLYISEHNENIARNRRLLESNVLVFADKNRNYWLDEDEATSVCRRIPNKNCESPLAGPFIYGMQDFTDRELGYYFESSYAMSMNDMVGRDITRALYYAYTHNRFTMLYDRAVWWHYDESRKDWYRYIGDKKIWESSLSVGDICRGKKNYPPTICPPDLQSPK